jgi:hypothetical protein
VNINPNANLIINRNLYWKIRELIENRYSWVYKQNYNVLSAYPSTVGGVIIYPSFVLGTEVVDTIPYEIGSRDRYNFYTEIVVFSNGIAQRDEVTFYLFDNFHNRDYTLYNITTANPVAVGNYNNFSTLGIYRCMNAYYSNVPVPVELPDRKMRYESDITMDVHCPLF